MESAARHHWDVQGRTFHGEINHEGGTRIAREFLAAQMSCDAIICSSDRKVIGLRQIYQEAGLQPPPHPGFDNNQQVIQAAADLTTIAYNDMLRGWHGISDLIERQGENSSAGPHFRRIKLPLVIRSSCGCNGANMEPVWPELEATRLFPEKEKLKILRELMTTPDPKTTVLDRRWKNLIEEERKKGFETVRLRSLKSECLSGRGAMGPGPLEDALLEVGNQESFVREQTWLEQNLHLAGFVPVLGQESGMESLHSALADLMKNLGVVNWELKTELGDNDYSGSSLFSDAMVPSAVFPLYGAGEQIGCLARAPGEKLDYISTGIRYFVASQIAASNALHREQVAINRFQDAIHLLEQNNHKLEDLSERDSLTGLFNRQGFFPAPKGPGKEPGNRDALVY